MKGRLNVFGYGSLIFKPELPDQLVERRMGVVRGLVREFNRISTSRFVLAGEGVTAFRPPHPKLIREGRFHSLVLGTRAKTTGEIVGMVLSYPAAQAAAVIAAYDRREAVSRSRPTWQNMYHRRQRVAETDAGPITVIVYESNFAPQCPWSAPSELHIRDRAQALLSATPKIPNGPSFAEDSRGVRYLEGVRGGLSERGIVDEQLERLAEMVEELRRAGP